MLIRANPHCWFTKLQPHVLLGDLQQHFLVGSHFSKGLEYSVTSYLWSSQLEVFLTQPAHSRAVRVILPLDPRYQAVQASIQICLLLQLGWWLNASHLCVFRALPLQCLYRVWWADFSANSGKEAKWKHQDHGELRSAEWADAREKKSLLLWICKWYKMECSMCLEGTKKKKKQSSELEFFYCGSVVTLLWFTFYPRN